MVSPQIQGKEEENSSPVLDCELLHIKTPSNICNPRVKKAFRIQSRVSFHIRPWSRKSMYAGRVTDTTALCSQGTVHMHSRDRPFSLHSAISL